jgi:hypothetical protein
MLLPTPTYVIVSVSSCVNKRNERHFKNKSHSKSKEKKSKIPDPAGELLGEMETERYSCLEEQVPNAVYCIMQP